MQDRRILAVNFIGVVAITLVFFINTASSLEYRHYCLDEINLQREAEVNANFTGTDRTYIINQTIPCEYGCDSVTNRCNPAPVAQTAMTGDIVILIFGMVFWMWRRYR